MDSSISESHPSPGSMPPGTGRVAHDPLGLMAGRALRPPHGQASIPDGAGACRRPAPRRGPVRRGRTVRAAPRHLSIAGWDSESEPESRSPSPTRNPGARPAGQRMRLGRPMMPGPRWCWRKRADPHVITARIVFALESARAMAQPNVFLSARACQHNWSERSSMTKRNCARPHPPPPPPWLLQGPHRTTPCGGIQSLRNRVELRWPMLI